MSRLPAAAIFFGALRPPTISSGAKHGGGQPAARVFRIRIAAGRVPTMGIVATTLLGTAVAAAPYWSLRWSPRVDATREVGGQSHQPVRQTTELTRNFDGAAQAGFVHEFRDLDLPGVDGQQPDTNSYVHRLTLAWQRESDALRLRLGLTVAVSSNALKNAGDLGADDLFPAAGIAWRAGPAWLALYADDRLGHTLVYPGFELPLRPAPSHEIRLGFPQTSWQWQIAPNWRALAAIEPDGACWRVRDAELEHRSQVCSRSWQSAWSLRWQATGWLAAEAGIGYRFESSVEYQLRDRRTVKVSVPGGSFYFLGIGARF
jgi:hypothetical protein